MPFRLTDLLSRHAREQPDAVVLSFDTDAGGRLERRYGELEDRAGRVAAALAADGLTADGRVVWIGKNRPELLDLLFAAPRLRAATAPLNQRLTADELVAITADADARIVVLGPDTADLADRLAALDGVRRVLVVGGPDPSGAAGHAAPAGDYDAWLAAAGPAIDPPEDAADDDCVLQLYTSGTTGLPKGVLLTHVQFSALLDAGEAWDIDAASVGLVAMPLFHIGGTGFALVCLAAGARIVLVGDIVPDRLLATMADERVTNAFLVPAVLQFLTGVPGAADRDWSALRSIAYGASPITTAVLTAVLETFRAPLFQVYGATETTGAITQLDPADHDPEGPRAHLMRSAGRAYPWVELKAVDPVSGADLGPDEVGEIWIRSAQVTPGYWRRPEATAEALTDDGWLRTGDGGYLDAEGYLFLTDRIKDMIVTGAENVYPVEVEDVLSRHPQVADVAVIGVPDERWGEAVKAVVVAREGETIDHDELLGWAKERMAGFKRPRSVAVVDALPRNASGKLLKRELRAEHAG